MSEDWERVTKADLIAIYDAVLDPITERFEKLSTENAIRAV